MLSVCVVGVVAAVCDVVGDGVVVVYGVVGVVIITVVGCVDGIVNGVVIVV